MILCTGHKGFIGQRMVAALSKRRIAWIGADKGDDIDAILRRNRLSGELHGVIHLGAISDTTCTDVEALHETNVMLPTRIAVTCAAMDIPFVYASSASVYGNGDGPLNAYARSKATFDGIMTGSFGTAWYGCRLFNVYGPGEAHKGKQASMVHQMIETISDGEKPRLFYPDAGRDFIYVDDVVEAMIMLLRKKPAAGLYDVGRSFSDSFERVFELIEMAMGVSNGYVEIDMPESLQGKYQFHTCADIAKLANLGWQPSWTLMDGIGAMLTARNPEGRNSRNARRRLLPGQASR